MCIGEKIGDIGQTAHVILLSAKTEEAMSLI
jgi:hypothetical protein